MPGKIKVKVLAGRNLPVMDRAGDTTDAFVEVKFGGVTHKTDVCRKSLNPHWNSTEWYRFEVDESELQDEPLQLRLMDHDTYSANDAIGKVVISLAPLLARDPPQKIQGATGHPSALMSGWIPVFDTMHGIRGELNVIVKVELFSDFNKYKTSSCGVQFFHCPMIPPGYKATTIHGFVEELVVNDDPEYQWIDKIRTPRASNEARQVAFIKLSNQVQRLVGLKAAELGANAVVGYQQDFDLEGEAGVVARAIGTAVTMIPLPMPSHVTNALPCSQQQLKKYLDILSPDNETIGDLNQYFQTHQEELQKLVNILHPNMSSNFLDEPETFDEDDKSLEMTRQSSIKSYTDNVSIYQDDYMSQKSLKHISKDQTDLNKLLNQQNERSNSSSPGPFTKLKNFKKHFLSRKKGSTKSRKQSDDQVSLKSNSSDTSKISIIDIKNEFNKLKSLTKPKFHRTVNKNDDEGLGMASILARSVIHAHTSLSRISESHDSEHSTASTLRRTSESEPTISISDEERSFQKPIDNTVESNSSTIQNKVPEIRFSSLNNVNIEQQNVATTHRELSESCPSTPTVSRLENVLKPPKEEGYYDSVSSALSGDSSEIYSSSDEDDEESDTKTDERFAETTSSVVASVLKHEVDPTRVAQMEKKLNELEKILPETASRKGDDTEKKVTKMLSQTRLWTEQNISPTNLGLRTKSAMQLETIPLIDKESMRKSSMVEGPSSDRYNLIKFHNPFSNKKPSKSISVPSSPTEKKSSFVYRQSKKIKKKISKISHTNLIKSVSHSLLTRKKDPKPFSQNSSSSDVLSKGNSHETVLGSPFLSYNDLLSLDRENFKENNKNRLKVDEPSHDKIRMYIGSEPASRCSFSVPSSPTKISENKFEDFHHSHLKKEKPLVKPTGLVHTAMETILMDKVQSLLIPTTPEPIDKIETEKKFFDDVNKKLEKYEESRLESRSSGNVQPKTPLKNTTSTGLIHTAMETILMDKVHSLLIPTTPDVDAMKEGNFNFDFVESEVYDKNQNITSVKTEPHKKLIRQNSLHSSNEDLTDESFPIETIKDNVPNISISCQTHKNKKSPVLQHFHPMLSGVHKLPHLETIPSLPESCSIDYSQPQSLDDSRDLESSIDKSDELNADVRVSISQECSECNTNIEVSVCDNSHAACRGCVHRAREERGREREKEKEKDKDKGSPRHARHESYGGREPQQHNTSLNATSTPVGMHRRSSDSDLSVTPKGSSQTASGGNTGTSGGGGGGGGGGGAILRPSMNTNNLEMLEYPFLTMTEYPSGFIVHIGGTVCARSVKLLDGGGEGASRAAWWAELRTELRAHARALRCTAVLGYSETTAICEDVCVLSASGTAAVINLDCDFNADSDFQIIEETSIPECLEDCSAAHVPYSTTSGPHRTECTPCGSCRRSRVPAVLLATCARPKSLKIPEEAKAITVTAATARVRRAPPQSEPGARDISDQLPFLEYELHKLLLAKLRMQGANALFSLRTQVALGERCVAALASGTAVRLSALPPPAPPRIKASEGDKDAVEIQRALWDTFTANKAANGFDTGLPDHNFNGVLLETDNEEVPTLDLCSDKDACVLELDEAEDVETARSLAIKRSLMQVFTHEVPPVFRAPPLAFAQVCRARLQLGGGSAGGAGAAGERHVARTLDAVAYKLRTLRPFALTAPKFQLDLPEDEIQLVVSGTAIRLQDPNKLEASSKESQCSNSHSTADIDDAIFAFDEEQSTSPKFSSETEEKNVIVNGQCPSMVALTTLSRLAGAKRQRFVCALQLLFVRETTSVRELGGFSGFLHTFMVEVLAIARAHTAALGGNALTSFYITQLMLQDNAHKNQGQCLLSVGGDVVNVTY